MTTLNIKIGRKVETIFGKEIEKKAEVATPQFDALAEIADHFRTESALVEIVNFALRSLAQRQANNDLKAASSGLNEADTTSVRQILRYINQAKELGDDPKTEAERILGKPKFAHLRPIFEGEVAGTVQLDYTGHEEVDGVEVSRLRAPNQRERSE